MLNVHGTIEFEDGYRAGKSDGFGQGAIAVFVLAVLVTALVLFS